MHHKFALLKPQKLIRWKKSITSSNKNSLGKSPRAPFVVCQIQRYSCWCCPDLTLQRSLTWCGCIRLGHYHTIVRLDTTVVSTHALAQRHMAELCISLFLPFVGHSILSCAPLTPPTAAGVSAAPMGGFC